MSTVCIVLSFVKSSGKPVNNKGVLWLCTASVSAGDIGRSEVFFAIRHGKNDKVAKQNVKKAVMAEVYDKSNLVLKASTVHIESFLDTEPARFEDERVFVNNDEDDECLGDDDRPRRTLTEDQKRELDADLYEYMCQRDKYFAEHEGLEAEYVDLKMERELRFGKIDKAAELNRPDDFLVGILERISETLPSQFSGLTIVADPNDESSLRTANMFQEALRRRGYVEGTQTSGGARILNDLQRSGRKVTFFPTGGL